MPIYISYFTADEIYMPAANRLKISLDKLNLNHEIICCPSRGTWNLNTCYKANFIHAMLQAYDPLDLIWIDADAEVMQYPILLEDIKQDIASVVNNQGLLASVIYFSNTPKVRNLVETWIAANKANPNEFTGDQINLDRLLKKDEFRELITFKELPWEYSYIPGIMGQIDNPVILQHQASRQGRALYGNTRSN